MPSAAAAQLPRSRRSSARSSSPYTNLKLPRVQEAAENPPLMDTRHAPCLSAECAAMLQTMAA